MNIKILTDSTSDLSKEYILENNLDMIPLFYTIGGKEYEDGINRTLSLKEFYDKLDNGESSVTSQVTPAKMKEYFEKYVNEGYAIIYLCFSSGMSGTYNSSIIAKNEILEENKKVSIDIIDTRSGTAGQALLVTLAVNMLKSGKSKEEIVKYIEDNKANINTWITVDTLEHLRRGGRLSTTSAVVGGALDIKPLIVINKEGKLNSFKKIRGRKKSFKILVEETKKRIINHSEQTVFIHHADCLEDALNLKKMIIEEIKVKNVEINLAGPIVGSHTGRGMISIAFMGKSFED